MRAAIAFIANRRLSIPFSARLRFVYDVYRISLHVDCAHTQAEILEIATAVFSLAPALRGCIVEAGCFKGGATAKLSLAAKLTGRTLFAFDSFEGLPENAEAHGRTILGETPNFEGGRYRGDVHEVHANVARYADISRCRFMKGWFDDTMPSFDEPIAVAFLDVDLASSTQTCLKYLYPLLQPGGSLFSHDGHLPLVLSVFTDDEFWTREVRSPKPELQGVGTRKLLRVSKRAFAQAVAAT